jgi:hypothetical protein
MRIMKNACNILDGKLDGKRPPGKPRCRWNDNIEMGVRDGSCVGVQWVQLAQDRV